MLLAYNVDIVIKLPSSKDAQDTKKAVDQGMTLLPGFLGQGIPFTVRDNELRANVTPDNIWPSLLAVLAQRV